MKKTTTMKTKTARTAPRHAVAAAGLVAAGLGAAGPCLAQSLTLSGVADGSVRVVRNEGRGTVTGLASGGNSTSKLILRGEEDLGGGVFAGFHLEHGFLLDSGTPVASTMFWDRRATVSLGDKAWGEIRAGREYVPTYANWSRYDPFVYVGAAGTVTLFSATPAGPIRSAFGTGVNTTVRTSNSVQYLLPAMGGWEGGVLVAAGEGGTAANGQHKVVGARFGYATAARTLAVAWTRTENSLTGSDQLDDVDVGGAYDFGPVKLSAAWRRLSLGAARQVNLMLGVWIPMGRGQWKASWNRVDMQGRAGTVAIGRNDAQQWALGYVHELSKRSAVYATLVHLRNQGASSYAVPGGAAGLAGGADSSGGEMGVRHNF
jgi:predicted porin